MRLTKETIQKINTPTMRLLLALGVKRSEQRIVVLINQNKDNSILTTAAALKVIKQETGLEENEILEEVSHEVGNAKISA